MAPKRVLLCIICTLVFTTLRATPGDTVKNSSSNSQKTLKAESLGNPVISVHGGLQLWGRLMQNNPNTVDASGNISANTADLAIRRARVSLMANWGNRNYLYTQVGTNNISFTNGADRQPIFIHDLWVQRALIPKKWYVGGGLHGWNGISRLSNISYAGLYMLDNPGFNYPDVGHTDLMVRQLGLFTHGSLGAMNFRLALNKPFTYDQAASEEPMVATEISSNSLEYKAYIYYQFWDRETPVTTYLPMTSLGQKKILNIGAGTNFHPNSIQYLEAEGSNYRRQSRQSIGVDLLMEYPLPTGDFFNGYLAAFQYDYGPGFLRSGGIMNPGGEGSYNGVPLAQGGGNLSYIFGTGRVIYGSFGYGLPDVFPHLFQPTFAFSYKDLEALGEPSLSLDLGFNFFVKEHKIKYSVQASSRPVYASTSRTGELMISSYKWCGIVQLQLYL